MADIERQKKAYNLFERYEGNPILTPREWPYPVNAVMNPGAIKMNSETVLLVRVEDMRGFSHLTIARSTDGFTNWQIDDRPTFEADHGITPNTVLKPSHATMPSKTLPAGNA